MKIDYEQLAKDVRAAAGVRVRGYVNQKGINLQYGYAFADLPYADGPGYHEHALVNARREGGAVPFREVELVHEIGEDYDALVAFCADVLRTGRTVECGAGVGLREIRDIWPYGSPCDRDLLMLVQEIKGQSKYRPESWDLTPDYQRGHVWTERQSSLFVGHYLEGGAVPPIFAQRYDKADNAPPGVTEYWRLPVEVVDGQQRLRALVGWVDGDFAAELTDGRQIWFRDTNEVDRFCLPPLRITFLDVDRATRLRFYLRLNRGGTIHTDDELSNVRDLLKSEETVEKHEKETTT